MAHKWVITVALVFLVIFLNASTSFSEETSKDVEILLYYNSGGYTVDYVQLFWEKDGVQKRRSWKGDVMLGEGFCARLSTVDGLEEGSEVWLKFKIAGGDKESCRKSEKMIYKSMGQEIIQYYYSKGRTLNGNRCRKTRTPPHVSGDVTHSTGNCNYFNAWGRGD